MICEVQCLEPSLRQIVANAVNRPANGGARSDLPLYPASSILNSYLRSLRCRAGFPVLATLVNFIIFALPVLLSSWYIQYASRQIENIIFIHGKVDFAQRSQMNEIEKKPLLKTHHPHFFGISPVPFSPPLL